MGHSKNAASCRSGRRWVGRWRTGASMGLLVVLPLAACGTRTDDDSLQVALALSAPRPAAGRGAERSVTLLTGARVILRNNAADSVSIVRARGRENIRFVTQRFAQGPGQSPHLYAIPEDAMPLIAAGKVDRRLFDVTLLVEFGYDDARRDSLPLIVTYPPNRGRATAASARAVSGVVVRGELPSINGMTLTASKNRAPEVWGAFTSGQAAAGTRTLSVGSEPIDKLWLDGLRQPVLDHSVPQIGAPAAWELGYQGNGVTVAVLDTGVDATHPDLADRVFDRENFTD